MLDPLMAQLGEEQHVGGVAEAGAPDLARPVSGAQEAGLRPQADAGPAGAPAVQQVLQVDVARGQQVGGRGVEHRGELQHRRPVISGHGARDGGAESLTRLSFLSMIREKEFDKEIKTHCLT